MNIVTVEQLSKSYGEKTLFADLTFTITDVDKIGLVGINGTGKSSLLALIAGSAAAADQGQIMRGNTKIAFSPQTPEFIAGKTVLEQVLVGQAVTAQLLNEYEQLLAAGGDDEHDTARRIIQLSEQIDDMGGWQLESEAKTILNKLGISNVAADIGTLSGGQQKRVALARALIMPAELLILDEPTNHLDHEAVEWLEQYLNNRNSAVLMVTHDRYFLDRVTNRIFELDQGQLYSYNGNYSYFLAHKLERELQQEASERKRQKMLQRELLWLERGAQARSTKQKARLQRAAGLQAEPIAEQSSHLAITSVASRLGRKIITLERVSYAIDSKPLITNFSYTILRDDRIGIIGPNGSGKSTLLNIIAGKLRPTQGVVDVGATVKLGYFEQTADILSEQTSVLDYVKQFGHYVPTSDGKTISAAQMLERFSFQPAMQWTAVSKLSGGEKRRLQLLCLLMTAPNVLLLDEPTNDFDLTTLTNLADYIDEFKGAVLLVSHDRYLLDRLAKTSWVFADGGNIKYYAGGYSDYKAAAAKQSITPLVPAAKSKPVPTVSTPQLRRLTFNEQQEYEQLEASTAEVEAELRMLTAQLAQVDSDYILAQQFVQAKQDAEARLEQLLTRWLYLTEIAEQAVKEHKL